MTPIIRAGSPCARILRVCVLYRNISVYIYIYIYIYIFPHACSFDDCSFIFNRGSNELRAATFHNHERWSAFIILGEISTRDKCDGLFSRVFIRLALLCYEGTSEIIVNDRAMFAVCFILFISHVFRPVN